MTAADFAIWRGGEVAASYFKPQGIPMRMLEECELELDEIEAIRLADLEGLYQVDGAARMGGARQTFGNIIARAHKKVATALPCGKAQRIAGAGQNTLSVSRQMRFSGTLFKH